MRRAAWMAALWSLIAAVAISASGCASVNGFTGTPPSAVRAILDEPALAGTRWGLMAVTAEGEPVIALNADQRFIPASNTKIFTTAAAFALLDDLDAPGALNGTSVRLEERSQGGAADVVLIGAGDAQLGDGPACVADCLSELADATATRVRRVGDVIGDDGLYPDERWGPGWSWEDMQESFGAAVSALTVNDNVVVLEVTPGAAVGAAVQATWRAGDDLQPIEIGAVTTADGDADLRLERRPGQEGVRLDGRMPLGGTMASLRVGLDDPALTAARRFRRLLEARGVTVEGEVRSRHRSRTLADENARRAGNDGAEVAHLARPPLLATLTRTAKFSQNLHAELMLRRLGLLEGTGSRADGLSQVEAVMATAGVPRGTFDLYDGSGLSAYNRVTPRAVTTFLLWSMHQPWGEAWRATLPVGGRDGTLLRRFVGTPLEGKVFAKTGTLNGVTALAGFLTATSGRTLVFAIYANDRPSTAGSALEAMDRALVALAQAN